MYFSMAAAPWPKRLDTILTSSGWETSLGMGRGPFRVPPQRRRPVAGDPGIRVVAIIGEQTRHGVGTQLIVELVVHLDSRRPAAGADALDFFERENAIGRHAFMSDTEFLLEALVQIVGSAQHATDIGTHLNVVGAHRLEAQHGVVGRHVAD